MAFSDSNFKHLTKHFPLDHRPRMLKDFLTDDSNSSFASTGFKSFPRKPILLQTDLNDSKLLTCRSRAASTTISAFQAMINAVKNIHLTAIKSPSILPKSLSRRLSSSERNSCRCRETETQNEKENGNKETQTKIPVTIKDIIRWKSFRDINEEKSQPLDLASSPHHCTTTTTTTTTAATTPRSSYSSNGSSWCDSDFTSEYGNFEDCADDGAEGVGKKYLLRVGEEKDSMEPAAVGPKAEKQQNGPVSVIDIEVEEDEESSSFLDQSLDTVNLEKWFMSMEENSSSGEEDDDEEATETNTIYEEEEEEAWQLLKQVREIISVGELYKHNVDRMLLDIFRDELSRNGNQSRNVGFGCEMVSRVKAWVDGEQSLWIGWDKKEAYVIEMEREGKWREFEEEQEEIALAIENCILDELLVDLFS